MNQEVKQKWLEALRSGEYAQGMAALRDNGTYCCLGVLCDLHSKETGTAWENESKYLGVYGVLPLPVFEWAGLSPDKALHTNPMVTYKGYTTPLTELNDGTSSIRHTPLPFTDIADLIEKQF